MTKIVDIINYGKKLMTTDEYCGKKNRVVGNSICEYTRTTNFQILK